VPHTARGKLVPKLAITSLGVQLHLSFRRYVHPSSLIDASPVRRYGAGFDAGTVMVTGNDATEGGAFSQVRYRHETSLTRFGWSRLRVACDCGTIFVLGKLAMIIITANFSHTITVCIARLHLVDDVDVVK